MDNISVGSNNNIEQERQARLIAVGFRAYICLAEPPQFGVVNFDGKLPENYPNWTNWTKLGNGIGRFPEQQPV